MLSSTWRVSIRSRSDADRCEAARAVEHREHRRTASWRGSWTVTSWWPSTSASLGPGPHVSSAGSKRRMSSSPGRPRRAASRSGCVRRLRKTSLPRLRALARWWDLTGRDHCFPSILRRFFWRRAYHLVCDFDLADFVFQAADRRDHRKERLPSRGDRPSCAVLRIAITANRKYAMSKCHLLSIVDASFRVRRNGFYRRSHPKCGSQNQINIEMSSGSQRPFALAAPSGSTARRTSLADFRLPMSAFRAVRLQGPRCSCFSLLCRGGRIAQRLCIDLRSRRVHRQTGAEFEASRRDQFGTIRRRRWVYGASASSVGPDWMV